MSSYGYQAGPITYRSDPPSPFDIVAINREIDSKINSLPPGDRGRATIQIKDGNVIGSLIIRAPQIGAFRPFVLGEVMKPRAGAWSYSASAGVSFLVGDGHDSISSVRVLPGLRGLYRLFRVRGYDQVTASIKAVLVSLGAQVTLA